LGLKDALSPLRHPAGTVRQLDERRCRLARRSQTATGGAIWRKGHRRMAPGAIRNV